jgi:hypothetical protein
MKMSEFRAQSTFSHTMTGEVTLSSITGYKNYNASYNFGFSSIFVNYGTGNPDFNLNLDSAWTAYSGQYYWWRILACSAGVGTFTPESEEYLPLRIYKNPVSSDDLITSQALTPQELRTHRVSKRHIKLYEYDSKYPNCGAKNLQLLTAVVARDLEEVCSVLKSPKFGPRVDFQILSIKKYKEPITGGGINTELIDQEFCNVPECLEFCIDLDFALETSLSQGKGPYRPFIFEMTAVMNMRNVESTIQLNITGSAQVLYLWYTSQGYKEISGSSLVVSPNYEYNSYLNLNISNELIFSINPIISSGYIILGGITSDVVTPKRYYEPKLNLIPSSLFEIRYQQKYDSYAFLSVGGGAIFNIYSKFEYESEGQISLLGGYYQIINSYWQYQSDGFIDILNSNSQVISAYRAYVAQGSMTLSGNSNKIGRCLELSGNSIEISGDSDVFITSAFDFSGSIELGGISGDVVSPNQRFESNGDSLLIDGGSDYNFTNIGLLVAYANFYSNYSNASIDNIDYLDGESNLSITEGSVSTCGCLGLGLSITLNNNLAFAGVLSEFLLNNSLTIDSNLVLGYRKNTNSWFGSQNLKGKSNDNKDAFWQLIFELACTNIIDNQVFDDYYLKFSFIANYQKGTNRYKTNFVININANDICADNGQLSTNIILNTNTSSVFVDGVDTTHSLYDGVGLFTNDYWGKKLNYSALRASCPKTSTGSRVATNLNLDSTKTPEVVGNFPQFRINYSIPTPDYCTIPLVNPVQTIL